MLHITKHGIGRPLVLFHGWGFDGRIWESLVLVLIKRGFQVFVVDLPGFGLSSLMSWEEFLAKLLDKLPDKFALVGWSMGGLWATRLCLEAYNRVTHLINIASSPYFIKQSNWSGIDISVLNKFYQQLLEDPKKTLEEFVFLQLQDKSLIDSKVDLLAEKAGLRLGLDVLLNWDLRVKLKEIKIPVCYLFGRKDAIVPRRVMQIMQVQFPDFQYVLLDNAAHVPFLSHQDAVIDLLVELI